MSATRRTGGRLVDHFEAGPRRADLPDLGATYACNLACVHCLSSSGRRDPRELTTAECKAVIDELQRMQVFYVNIGGGEPTVRRDFWELRRLRDRAPRRREVLDQRHRGSRRDRARGSRRATTSTCRSRSTARPPRSTTRVRGAGSYATAIARDGAPRRRRLARASSSRSSSRARTSAQLDEFKAIADRYGAQLRLTRLRPSGRGADVWDELHPTAAQQRELYDWLLAHGEEVLTGDSFFHLAAYGEPLPGLNLCGAGRVVCLIDPVGDVYACPFAIHDAFLAGNVRDAGGFAGVWRESELFLELREPQAAGACASCCSSTTRAAAAAWRRSSSPACRSTGPTRSACSATASALLAARGERPTPRSPVDHSRRHRPVARATRTRSRTSGASRCDGEQQRLVRVGRRGAAARAASACPSSVYGALRRRRGARRRRSTTTSRRSASSASCRASPPACRRSATWRRRVMGQPISLPVIISPTGVQAVHPDGEVAVARAAAARGHRDGSRARSRASRSRRSSRPTRRRSSRCTGWARASA